MKSLTIIFLLIFIFSCSSEKPTVSRVFFGHTGNLKSFHIFRIDNDYFATNKKDTIILQTSASTFISELDILPLINESTTKEIEKKCGITTFYLSFEIDGENTYSIPFMYECEELDDDIKEPLQRFYQIMLSLESEFSDHQVPE